MQQYSGKRKNPPAASDCRYLSKPSKKAYRCFVHRIGYRLSDNKSCEFPTKLLNFFRSSSRICHSEERSDEESVAVDTAKRFFLFRSCEAPSRWLRMTRDEIFLPGIYTKKLPRTPIERNVRGSFLNRISAAGPLRSLPDGKRLPYPDPACRSRGPPR